MYLQSAKKHSTDISLIP